MNFMKNYKKAKEEGALKNKTVKKLIDYMTAEIMLTSTSIRQTVKNLSHDSSTKNVSKMISKTYSLNTGKDSTVICWTGGGLVKGHLCE